MLKRKRVLARSAARHPVPTSTAPAHSAFAAMRPALAPARALCPCALLSVLRVVAGARSFLDRLQQLAVRIEELVLAILQARPLAPQ